MPHGDVIHKVTDDRKNIAMYICEIFMDYYAAKKYRAGVSVGGTWLSPTRRSLPRKAGPQPK